MFLSNFFCLKRPHVKSTLHTFLIHHFACIKFHLPRKTFYFPTNISFPTTQISLSFSLYLSHSLSHTHTHTHTRTHAQILTFTLTLTHTALPTPTPTRRDQPSATEPNADKAEPKVWGTISKLHHPLAPPISGETQVFFVFLD